MQPVTMAELKTLGERAEAAAWRLDHMLHAFDLHADQEAGFRHFRSHQIALRKASASFDGKREALFLLEVANADDVRRWPFGYRYMKSAHAWLLWCGSMVGRCRFEYTDDPAEAFDGEKIEVRTDDGDSIQEIIPDFDTIGETLKQAQAVRDREYLRAVKFLIENPAATGPTADESDYEQAHLYGPQSDRHDDQYAEYLGRRVYLGAPGTQVSKLFWLLADPLGVSRSLTEIQKALFGFSVERDYGNEEDYQRALKRVGKARDNLRARLNSPEFGGVLMIVCEDRKTYPSYRMIPTKPKR